MKQLLAIVVATFFFACAHIAGAFAQATPAPVTTCPAGSALVEGYTKKNGTAVAAYCKKSKKSSGEAAGTTPAVAPDAAAPTAAAATPLPAASAAAAPMTKSTAAAPSSMSTGAASTGSDATLTCPAGKSYVHGYTRKDGKKVAGYCRKSAKKTSS